MRPIARQGLPRVAGTGLAVLLAAALSPAAAERPATANCRANVSAEEPTRPAPCCFVHPSYAGVCVVQPAKDETCAGILAYLNNPESTGRTYCDNTSLRGDWRQVVCEKMPEPQRTQ